MSLYARASLAIVLSLSLMGPGFAAGMAIPQPLQGLWAAAGECGLASAQITIKANSLRFGTGAAVAVYFSPEDGRTGYGAILWQAEGDVSNFEVLPGNDQMAFNLEGFGQGPVSLYERCADL